ncbi:uncharacterized protein N7477_002011 [Penicillium maclennaniae]|uniref:uncharacterized protein n=1 Tax=Penicillium maclennaniae TaxID=1343394 RepID=UPI002542373D|nr:uncharacterized protein N7477_002011 [Penicillium maclennaniae]KAJ5682071.1 hypothetical protein N7477_002011 [Penicillium maclennaniae]
MFENSSALQLCPLSFLTVESAPRLGTMSYPDSAIVGPSSLMANLPHGYKDTSNILKALQDNKENGNQYLVLLGLSKRDIERLDDRGLSGLDYRFQLEGTVGLIKVVLSHAYDATTDLVTRTIDIYLIAMGIPLVDRQWAMSTTYKPTASKGKQADQYFTPPCRSASPGQPIGWPTFVIETGVSESLPRLREDAKWWFNNSGGEVRIVLVIGIRRTKVEFELWELAPPNSPRPLTRGYIDSLRQRYLPPLVQQTAGSQQMYSHHKVEVTSSGVVGAPRVDNAPMVLPFEALYNRPPGVMEGDLVLGDQNFKDFVGTFL